MTARGDSADLGIYSAADVVAHYADLDYLTAVSNSYLRLISIQGWPF